MTLASPPRPSAAPVLPTLERSHDLGPLSAFLLEAYLVIGFVLGSSSLAGTDRVEPFMFAGVLLLPIAAIGLLPRHRLMRLPLDGPLLLLVLWQALSVFWSLNPGQAVFEVRRDLTLVVAMSLCAGLLPRERAIRATLSSFYFIAAMTLLVVLLVPETRTHAADGPYLDDYPGWHGWFIHKNVLSPYLVFGVVTVLCFERSLVRKAVVLPFVALLMGGSQSGTGLAGLLLVGGGWVWFRTYQRSEGRSSTAFVTSSISVAFCLAMGALASLGPITSAYGKDLTFTGRTYIWASVFEASEQSPWLGYGLGGVFWAPFNEVTLDIWRNIGFRVPHAHNGPLDILVRFGLVGLLLFLVMLGSTIALGFFLLRRRPATGEWLLLVTAAQLFMGISEIVFLNQFLVYTAVMRAVALGVRRDILVQERSELRAAVRHAHTRLRPLHPRSG